MLIIGLDDQIIYNLLKQVIKIRIAKFILIHIDMNKTICVLIIVCLMVVVSRIFFVAPESRPHNDPFQDGFLSDPPKNPEKKKKAPDDDSYRVYGLFRICTRKNNFSLQLRGGVLRFAAKTDKDLWTFFDKQLYSFYNGIYLVYDATLKSLQTASDPSKTHFWVFSRSGRLLWVNKDTKKSDCVSADVLEKIPAENKKCVDYMFYLEVADAPFFAVAEGSSVVHSQLYYFPKPEKKKVKQAVSSETKIFKDGRIFSFGFQPSFSLGKVIKKTEMVAELDVKKPTVLWLVMTANISSNLDNVCKSFQEKKGKADKKSSTHKKGAKPAASAPAKSKAKNTCRSCPEIQKNFGIKYHIQYPGLLKKVASQSAAEFGVQDPSTHKIYRCRDILTSPYYVKKFGGFI